MSDYQLSKHARKRMRQRLGLNAKACERAFEKACVLGLRRNGVGGRLQAYLDHLGCRYPGADYLVTPMGIFAIKGNVVVTLLPLPVEHKKRVMTHWKKASGET